MVRGNAAAQRKAYDASMKAARRARPALLPPIAPDLFAYSPYENQQVQFTERKLQDRLRAQGGTWFRTTQIPWLLDCPAYALGIYVEGWRVDPARMEPPHRPAPFLYPLTAPRVPFQSGTPS